MNLKTKICYHRLALKLWRDITERGLKQKKDSIYYEEVIKISPNSRCPICEMYDCNNCPLTFPQFGSCVNTNHPFNKWCQGIERAENSRWIGDQIEKSLSLISKENEGRESNENRVRIFEEKQTHCCQRYLAGIPRCVLVLS